MPKTDTERVWWQRVERAAARKGEPVGTKGVMSEWCHDMLTVLGAREGEFDLVGPFGHRRWEPIDPERCTPAYKQAETKRLCDELGRKLGVGPKP